MCNALSDDVNDDHHEDDVYVCDSSEVLEGATKALIIRNRRVVVWRDTAGDVHVWDDYCPHRGAELSSGQVMGCLIVCPSHGWRFDINGQLVVPLSASTPPHRTAVFARAHDAYEQDGAIRARLKAF